MNNQLRLLWEKLVKELIVQLIVVTLLLKDRLEEKTLAHLIFRYLLILIEYIYVLNIINPGKNLQKKQENLKEQDIRCKK